MHLTRNVHQFRTMENCPELLRKTMTRIVLENRPELLRKTMTCIVYQLIDFYWNDHVSFVDKPVFVTIFLG